MPEITVIGIDPGSRFTGWGIVRENSGALTLVDCGLVRAEKGDGASFSTRLARIYRGLDEAIKRHTPHEAAIEQIFTAKNVASALKLGQARGAAVAACAANGLEICDYEPKLVKNGLTGAGSAEKEQVAFMVSRLLNLGAAKYPIDTTDALAVAICHLNQRRFTRLAAKAATSSNKNFIR